MNNELKQPDTIDFLLAVAKYCWDTVTQMTVLITGGIVVLGVFATIVMMLWKIAQWSWT